ncbi:nucleotidyltransferase domain-containing protein [Sporosarcina sp. Te-1]|uniref:nucleotidyltransferase domain-containing protein n=1 Tax=Sporosarcina sp. Te-1 TaxID=2818390 RepID=UPI001A9F6A6F|nr:nucleotidyltransferase domain-containing protein [Sporosarcina sp. Te-1]QTD40492.1 nucleotidyltransferase domain-containing protein [Sporosarcina sp. Te-1]
MKQQEIAVQAICESLKKDPHVEAVFLKGSMGRGEHDEHSDIDMYCMVKQGEEAGFLDRRLDHLRVYQEVIFTDDIYIVAPQLIAVFDNLLHIDLFTVTRESFPGHDHFTVLYDPHAIMKEFVDTQGLALTKEEYRDDVMDIAWFLFQYRKSAARGNDIWSVRMLTNVVHHLARALLHRYAPERAQLGLKTVSESLPEESTRDILLIHEKITPSRHEEAAHLISGLLDREYEWIQEQLKEETQTLDFLQRMIELHAAV